MLGTLHAWTSLSQVLQAFTSSQAHSSGTYSINYWLDLSDPKAQLRGYTAVLAVGTIGIFRSVVSNSLSIQNVMQNLVLIWRLLVVSGDWRWAIVPVRVQFAVILALYTDFNNGLVLS